MDALFIVSGYAVTAAAGAVAVVAIALAVRWFERVTPAR